MKIKRLLIFYLILFITSWSFVQNTEIENLVQEGIKFHDNGEYEKAIEKYLEALRIDPNSSLINYEMSFSYLLSKDYKNAEKYSKKVIDLNDGNLLGGYITYGSALDMQGNSSKSIKVYEQAMKDFDNYLLYYNHAVSCFNSGEINKAYDSAIKAINNNSSHASSHLILSKIMEQQGIRVKAMLPLYFFLLIEPNTQRAAIAYQTLRELMDQGVTQSTDKDINIAVPSNKDPDFGAAEMMISLSKASNSLAENKEKTDLQLFADNNDVIFKILGELKKENTGFWWDLYVTFFYELAEENLTETYSYYISQSQGEDVVKWFDENSKDFEKFKTWLSK
jgi:tetratricopeptide (TPR) repeat protein